MVNLTFVPIQIALLEFLRLISAALIVDNDSAVFTKV